MASLPTSVNPAQAETERTEGAVLSWTVHLIRRQPQRLPQIMAVLIGILVVGLCVFHSFWLALLPALMVLFSLSEFVFPIRYTLTQKSASVQHGLTALEIRWTDVRRAYLVDEGIKLSPLRSRNSRFEPLRGVFLRFDETNREQVIEIVKRLRSEGIAVG